jgi:hypothetical protein
VLQELQALAVQEEPGMFDFFRPFPWILKTHCYDTPEHLIADLDKQLIGCYQLVYFGTIAGVVPNDQYHLHLVANDCFQFLQIEHEAAIALNHDVLPAAIASSSPDRNPNALPDGAEVIGVLNLGALR